MGKKKAKKSAARLRLDEARKRGRLPLQVDPLLDRTAGTPATQEEIHAEQTSVIARLLSPGHPTVGDPTTGSDPPTVGDPPTGSDPATGSDPPTVGDPPTGSDPATGSDPPTVGDPATGSGSKATGSSKSASKSPARDDEIQLLKELGNTRLSFSDPHKILLAIEEELGMELTPAEQQLFRGFFKLTYMEGHSHCLVGKTKLSQISHLGPTSLVTALAGLHAKSHLTKLDWQNGKLKGTVYQLHLPKTIEQMAKK